MSEGWIYIVSTPTYSEQDLYKIGRTNQSPEHRAKQLSQPTGILEEFEVFFAKDVSDCELAEGMIHERLKSCRYRADREFFRVQLDNAKAVVIEVAEQIGEAMTFEEEINFETLTSYLILKHRDRKPSSSTQISKLVENLVSNRYTKIRDLERVLERSKRALREYESKTRGKSRLRQVEATQISLELCDPGFHKRIGERYPIPGFNIIDVLEPFRELVIKEDVKEVGSE